MQDETLFEMPDAQAVREVAPTLPGQARVLRPIRDQLEWTTRNLDEAIPADHPVRGIWATLQRMDLSDFYASIKAVVGHPGHPTTDPKVLLALWVFATTEGVGSARHLARLCEEHDGYRWLRGGVPINYHMLSDFRVTNRDALNSLLTKVVASLMYSGTVTLRHVAQDGMRVRACAGQSSFHRKASLEKCLVEAKKRVEVLAQQRENPDPGISKRQRAARERVAREQELLAEEALRRIPEMEQRKKKQSKTYAKKKREKITEARVSSTDPEATVMKMPCGGFQPAYNMEMATDVDSQVIVGVAVVTTGSDSGQACPMAQQIKERTGQAPEAYLMDGGFATRGDITALESQGICVYAPTRPPRTTTSGRTQGEPRSSDTPEVAEWRARMETPEAKLIYRERAATAECVNAQCRRRGVTQLVVRGAEKALSVLLLAAITHNIVRMISLNV